MAGWARFRLSMGPVGSFPDTPPPPRPGCRRLTPCQSAGLTVNGREFPLPGLSPWFSLKNAVGEVAPLNFPLRVNILLPF